MARTTTGSRFPVWRFLTAAAILLAANGAGGQSSPLPGVTIFDVKPILWFVLDTSGSMDTCDGGLFNTADAASMARYNPSAAVNDFDDGNCGPSAEEAEEEAGAGHVSFGALTWDHDANGGTPDVKMRNNGLETTTDRIFMISRGEALKVALGRVLDSNNDGTIDAVDEAALGFYIGMSFYDTGASGEYKTNAAISPAGSTHANVWTAIKGLDFNTGTPHGPAIAGGRALGLAKCYDNDGTTVYNGVVGGCALPAAELSTDGLKNDLSLACRIYYIVHVTDGETNTGSAITQDGPQVAKLMRYAKYAYGAEATDTGTHVLNKQIYVSAVGLGAVVGNAGSDPRAQINCMAFWGGGADANLDRDNNPLTMHTDTNGSTIGITITQEPTLFPGTTADNNPDTNANTYCNHLDNFDDSADVQTWYGPGFIAANADQLADALQAFLESVSQGTFSGGEPTLTFNGATGVSGTYVYGTFYDVNVNRLEWYGHMRKLRTKNGAYVDCDNASNTTPPHRPCWDAGGVAVVGTAGLVTANEYGDNDAASGLGYMPGLSERDWRTRRVFAPHAAAAAISYEDDESLDSIRTPSDLATRTVWNLVTPLALLTYPPTVANIATLTGTNLTDIQGWTAWSTTQTIKTNYIDTVDTYELADYAGLTAAQKQDAVNALMFVAGKPLATFSDNTTKRCAGCASDDAFSPKFGYPNHSKPIIVGPPPAFTTDAAYTTFKNSTLSATSIGSGEDVVERANAYEPAGLLTVANPCGDGWPGFDGNSDGDYADVVDDTVCKVKFRRKVVYVGGNDGAVHAFDERTGHELWAFVPPGMMRKLAQGRAGGSVTLVDGDAIVRDIKLPNVVDTNRFSDGSFHTVLVFSVAMGGRFYFALDVTNPVDPKFMWEAHNNEFGFTVARAEVGELAGAGTAAEPKSMVFVTSGYIPSSPAPNGLPEPLRLRFASLRAYDGTLMNETSIPLNELADSETAVAVTNALIGAPRAVDADLDGLTDRVYFGDLEGRMWKACDLQVSGVVTTDLFFDPAAYDRTGTPGAGQPDSGDADATPLGGLAGSAADRRTLRGPIYFAPDITHDGSGPIGTGKILVAFGSGNIQDLLTPPTSYKNFIWVVADNEAGSGVTTCDAPTASNCTGTTGINTYTAPGLTVFNNVNQVDQLLTGAPVILAGYLIYPEFERLTAASCGAASFQSRVVARDVFNCTNPATPPFRDALGVATSTITYDNTIVTGIGVDTGAGTLVVSCTTCKDADLQPVPLLQSQPTTLGIRQSY